MIWWNMYLNILTWWNMYLNILIWWNRYLNILIWWNMYLNILIWWNRYLNILTWWNMYLNILKSWSISESPWNYNWNIVESGVKNHNHPPIQIHFTQNILNITDLKTMTYSIGGDIMVQGSWNLVRKSKVFNTGRHLEYWLYICWDGNKETIVPWRFRNWPEQVTDKL
jgi:hypothetical protein